MIRSVTLSHYRLYNRIEASYSQEFQYFNWIWKLRDVLMKLICTSKSVSMMHVKFSIKASILSPKLMLVWYELTTLKSIRIVPSTNEIHKQPGLEATWLWEQNKLSDTMLQQKTKGELEMSRNWFNISFIIIVLKSTIYYCSSFFCPIIFAVPLMRTSKFSKPFTDWLVPVGFSQLLFFDFFKVSVLFKYLPPAYVVRGKVIFILGNVCLFTFWGGGSQVSDFQVGWSSLGQGRGGARSQISGGGGSWSQ